MLCSGSLGVLMEMITPSLSGKGCIFRVSVGNGTVSSDGTVSSLGGVTRSNAVAELIELESFSLVIAGLDVCF